MKTITREMIKMYNIKHLGYDFMGYTFRRLDDLSFHHLIVPKRDSKKAGIGNGYLIWNGAILNQETSHDYLHIIERTDREAFLAITSFMIQQNQAGQLSVETLKEIRRILLLFEEFHKDDIKPDGKKLIRQKYITDRIQF